MGEVPFSLTGGRSRYKDQLYIILEGRGQAHLTSGRTLWQFTLFLRGQIVLSLVFQEVMDQENEMSTKISPILTYICGNFPLLGRTRSHEVSNHDSQNG